MRPTLKYIEEKFDYYNNLCFGGKLPRPIMKLSQRRSAVGLFRPGYSLINGKRTKLAILEFSIRFDLPEVEYIDTIVHEMIHYYIWINDIVDDAPHGTAFRSKMNEISQKYGIRITIACDESEEALIARETDRNRFICVIEDNDENYAFAIVIKDKVFQYWDIVKNSPNVKEFKWYVSNRAIFEIFPSRIKPAFIPVNADKLQNYLFGALELENTGTLIKPIES